MHLSRLEGSPPLRSVAAAPREKTFLLAQPEARALQWIARRLPGWVKPDHLTVLGIVAALGIAAAYVLSNGDRAWLWAASALLVVHWLGDSLDGTLARVRRAERRFLPWLAPKLPRWVLPDDMTALGVAAAFGVCAAYQLTNEGEAWLWVASALLIVQWLGDSLDGTLARVRRIQRPKYGYYLDHLVDAIATAAIGIGLGLSPYMLLSVATLVVVAYLILSINVYLESYALGRFSLGYGHLGPTEIRLILILLNTALALGWGLDFRIAELDVTVLDVVGLGIAAVMIALLVTRAVKNLRELAREEPAASRR